jgi:hypothetical protein
MGRMLMGSVAAGVVMFLLGYVFYGTPLYVTLGGGEDTGPPSNQTMVLGIIQLSVAAYALSMLLTFVSEGSRMQAVMWAALTAVAYTYLGDPIWEGASWQTSIYAVVAGAIMLYAAGFVITKWFAPAKA